MYVYMCICICMYIYVCIYICMYIGFTPPKLTGRSRPHTFLNFLETRASALPLVSNP